LKIPDHFAEESKRETEWLAIAKRVLSGEFRSADRSTLQSIVIGLRSNPHPNAKKAVTMIQ
jgi:hypothetical protein